MTLLFIDSFDDRNRINENDLPGQDYNDFGMGLWDWAGAGYDDNGVTPNGGVGPGRFGKYSAEIILAERYGDGVYLDKYFPASYGKLIVGCARRYSVGGITFFNTGGNPNQYECELETSYPDGTLLLYAQWATQFLSRKRIFTIDGWNYIEGNVIPGDRGYVIANVDGETVIDGSYPTMHAGNTEVYDGFEIYEGGIDDVYVMNGDGVYNNIHLGGARVENKLVSGAGSVAQFTPHGAATNYQCVDDNPANGGLCPDRDATYTESSTIGHIDTFEFHPLISSAGEIHGVEVKIYCTSDDGTLGLRPYVRIGENTYTGDVLMPPIGNWEYRYFIWELSPDTNAEWTVSEVDNAEFGYTVVAGV